MFTINDEEFPVGNLVWRPNYEDKKDVAVVRHKIDLMRVFIINYHNSRSVYNVHTGWGGNPDQTSIELLGEVIFDMFKRLAKEKTLISDLYSE